jgi:hypothetical protein
MAFPLRLLSFGPRIRKRDGRLTVSTGWCTRLATLGMWYRRLVVDPQVKVITVHRRYFWLFARTRDIPFQAVKAVTYGYGDLSPASTISWAHDSLDVFSVGLRLRDETELHLFNFSGAGTFSNEGPWPDWMYWQEYLFDLSGTQETDSRAFVNLFSKMIGVKVQPPGSDW